MLGAKLTSGLQQYCSWRGAGALDIQDGPPSNIAWMYDLDWPGNASFNAAPRKLLHLAPNAMRVTTVEPGMLKEERRSSPGQVVGYRRTQGPLTHVVLRNAGHMAPHDQPEAAVAMMATWLHCNVLSPSADGADWDCGLPSEQAPASAAAPSEGDPEL